MSVPFFSFVPLHGCLSCLCSAWGARTRQNPANNTWAFTCRLHSSFIQRVLLKTKGKSVGIFHRMWRARCLWYRWAFFFYFTRRRFVCARISNKKFKNGKLCSIKKLQLGDVCFSSCSIHCMCLLFQLKLQRLIKDLYRNNNNREHWCLPPVTICQTFIQ